MSGIRVTSVAAIEEFEGYLAAFLSEFSHECAHLRQAIGSRRLEVENRLEEARMEYRSALDYLHSLEEPGWEDYDAVERAEDRCRRLAEFRERFESFVDDALARLNEIESRQAADVSAGVNSLAQTLNLARRYLAITPDSGEPLSTFSGQSPNAASVPASPTIIHGVDTGQSSALTSGEIGELPELPNGLKWVSVDDLDWQGVDHSLEFKKASETDIAAMMKVFERDLLPLLRSNPRISVEGLVKMDQEDGRSSATAGRSFAYEFLIGTTSGSDVIAVEQSPHGAGGRYFWQSGRHRALVAKKLGWQYVPARIVGRK